MRSVLTVAVLLLLVAPAGASPMLKPGDTFPAWELTDHTGAKVSSRDLAGKPYLLWFFPKAMTSGCTAEGDGLRDHIDGFKAKGVEILGVSFDTPEDNAKFVHEQSFPFRLLSDSDHKLANDVGAVYVQIQPYASRVSYLVGADGKVVKAYDSVTPASHAQQVLDDLAATPVSAAPAGARPANGAAAP
jgi:peroxiredoxin Q/BCP